MKFNQKDMILLIFCLRTYVVIQQHQLDTACAGARPSTCAAAK